MFIQIYLPTYKIASSNLLFHSKFTTSQTLLSIRKFQHTRPHLSPSPQQQKPRNRTITVIFPLHAPLSISPGVPLVTSDAYTCVHGRRQKPSSRSRRNGTSLGGNGRLLFTCRRKIISMGKREVAENKRGASGGLPSDMQKSARHGTGPSVLSSYTGRPKFGGRHWDTADKFNRMYLLE